MTAKVIANAQNRYEITAKELPLCCPSKRMNERDSHPRVYLAIAETGHAICPYCDAEYVLVDSAEKGSCA